VKTLEETEEDPNDREPADGDVKMEYFPDQLYRPSIEAVTRNYLLELSV